MRTKSPWVLAGLVLLGTLIGHLIGLSMSEHMPLLGRSLQMGLGNPVVTLDLGVLALSFGLTLDLSLAGALGMLIALILVLRR